MLKGFASSALRKIKLLPGDSNQRPWLMQICIGWEAATGASRMSKATDTDFPSLHCHANVELQVTKHRNVILRMQLRAIT